MKKTRITKNIIPGMTLLSIFLVLLWVIFYYLTVNMIRKNMYLQAETGSEAIISAMEEELLSLENGAFELGHNAEISAILSLQDTLPFYDALAAFHLEHPILPGNVRRNDNVILFGENGDFYRLQGTISNTTLKRCYHLMKTSGNKTLTVVSNGNTYIGSYEAVTLPGGRCGYVSLLTDKPRMDLILNTFHDLDYLGVALFSGDRILCANKDIRTEDLSRLKAASVFYREKDIGLSGYRLIVYCEQSISKPLSDYFRLALPITILILITAVLGFTRYQSRQIVKETELEKERTLTTLLKKQISAHFTVNTLNVVRSLVSKGEENSAMMICDELSTLLRYANAGEENISLLEEFYVLEQYIGIMQTRYPGKIECFLDEDDTFAEVFIPRMLIQPIVENAILHGLGGNRGKIRITAKVQGEMVTICVEDNGRGLTEEELMELRLRIENEDTLTAPGLSHIALQNIQRRIRMVCGKGFGLTVLSELGKGTRVYVALPKCP